ncbi:MAG: hypothetical protein ACYS7Y_27325 [Planctomycetota bacterium]|jgi:hypothetical protein
MTIERRVRIVQDSDGYVESPREWDNAGRMICWHDRYNLGDEHSYSCSEFFRELACEHDADLEEYIDRLEGDVGDKLYDRAVEHGCEGWEACTAYAERFIRKRINDRIESAIREGYVVLPLYLYDHSGITISTGSFSCIFDSGQIGWIICDKDTVEKEWDGNRERAEKWLRNEVAVYDQFITGDVWGFIAEQREVMDCWDLDDEEGWETTDSCWGFYGSDPETNGIKDHLCADYHDALDDARVEYA